jgi:O-antigen ligase
MSNQGASVVRTFIQSGKLSYFSCLLSVIILPAHVDFLPPFMILWVLSWIVENLGSFKDIADIKNDNFRLFLGFLLFFMWYITGLFYTNDLSNGKLLIFRRLSFLLFPLVLIKPGILIKKNLMLILKVFAISTLLYIIFSYGFAIYRSIYLKDGSFLFNPHPIDRDYDNYFFGTDFAFSQHPTYLAMYVILSVFIAFNSCFDKKLSLNIKYFWIAAGIIMLSSLYFISSRAGILSAMFLTPVYLVIQFRKINRGWISVVVLTGALIIFIISFLHNDRIKYYLPEKEKTSVVEKLKLDNRVPIWKSALKVIHRNYFLGVGAGDASAELRKAYKEEGYTEMYYDNLNAHNQYLETFLANGIVGFSILIFIIAFMVYKAFRERKLFLGLYIFIIVIFFLFESLLNRIAGVTFFSLFAFLLMNLEGNKQSSGTRNVTVTSGT